jgi:hypothetical protein
MTLCRPPQQPLLLVALRRAEELAAVQTSSHSDGSMFRRTPLRPHRRHRHRRQSRKSTLLARAPYEFRHRCHVEIWCAHLEHNRGCCDLLGRARCQTPCRCSRAKPDHISVGTHATQDASTPFSAHGTFLRSQRRFFIVLPDDLCHQIKPIDQMKSHKNPNEPTDH